MNGDKLIAQFGESNFEGLARHVCIMCLHFVLFFQLITTQGISFLVQIPIP